MEQKQEYITKELKIKQEPQQFLPKEINHVILKDENSIPPGETNETKREQFVKQRGGRHSRSPMG